jgi:hypothetical protein
MAKRSVDSVTKNVYSRSGWNPEVRCSSRKQTDQKAEAMFLAVEKLLKNL